MHSTFVKPRCTALSSSLDAQHFRQASIHLRDPQCTPTLSQSITLTLAVHVFCEHAIETNTDTSYCSECIHMCMDLQKISVLYMKHTCSFLGRGGGSKEMMRFRFFANIVNLRTAPELSFSHITPVHRLVIHQQQWQNIERVVATRTTPFPV